MAVVGMKQLLEAGVHFGHQTRRWNPKMKQFIYTERNGIHIIDLQKTVGLLDRAYGYVQDVTRDGGRVLFVGTKKQAQDAIAEEASRAGQFFVNQRWLGGLLTNFNTIQQRLRRLEELEQMRDTGVMSQLPKKEQLKLTDEFNKLQRMLGGIRGMRRLPDALFIVDTRKEHIAIHEAHRLGIPVVALVDTNSDPDEVDYPIPANDDAIRAVRLLSGKIADAAYEGAQERASTMAKDEAEEGEVAPYEGGYVAEPEGYNASLDDEFTDQTTVSTQTVTAPDQDSAAEHGAISGNLPEGLVESRQSETPEAVEAEGIAADSATDDNVPSNDIASGGLVGTGESAFAGGLTPAGDEAGLGVHPDAAE